MSDKQALLAQLGKLREQFAQQLPGRLDHMSALSEALEREWGETTARELRAAAHGLAGSAGTFGFAAVGELAKVLEAEVVRWLDGPVAQGEIDWKSMHARLASARALAGEPAALGETPVLPEAVNLARPKVTTNQQEPPPLVYLVDDDPVLTAELALQLDHYGYAIKCFHGPAPMFRWLDNTVTPDVIIMDMMFPDDISGAEAVSRLKQGFGNALPVIYISAREDLEARLAAVRSGFDAYFTKPLNIDKLLDKLDALTRPPNIEHSRVLIVDDDRVLAETHAAVLRGAGMEVRVVCEPMTTLDVLRDFVPDLILMDLYMPDCLGSELTAAIRQEDAYLSIPVVYLSTEQVLQNQLAAIARGGDDFLTKPINLQALVLSVQTRMQRARQLRGLMIHDSMTGLLNHARTKEALDIELSRAQRGNSPLAVVMIDLDHFKKVNDHYGHAAGDRVIGALARMLKQRLRGTDVIGRYGGEEFVVGLPNTDARQAMQVMEAIREAFAGLNFDADGRRFGVSFSAGIASLAAHAANAQQLLFGADQALYKAKRAGRNRIEMADNLVTSAA